MKMRFLAYFVLLPVILLMAFVAPVSGWVGYIAWGAFILSVLLVVYAIMKTKQICNSKKVFFALIMLLSVFLFEKPVMAFNGYENMPAGALQAARNPAQVQSDPCGNAESDLKTLRETRLKLSKIPKANRTPQQQQEYDNALKKMNDLMAKCEIQPCPDISELYKEAVDDCWICTVAELFIVAGDKVATTFYNSVSDKRYALALLAIGFFMWLLVRALSLVGSFGATDVGRFFTDFFVKCLMVGAVAAILLVPLRDTVDFIVSPFFIFSSSVNRKLIEISDSAVSGSSLIKIDELMSQKLGGKVECKYCENLKSGANSDPDKIVTSILQYNVPASKHAVPAILRNSILCSICSIYRVTTPPVVSGQFLFCSAKQLKKDWGIGPKEKVYKDLGAVIVGGILSWTFIAIVVLFSFYLIDSFVRLCFVLVLFPFLLVAFVFQSTRQYTKKALDVLIHTMVTYIVVSVFMVLLIQIFYTLLGGFSEQIVEALANPEDPYTALHNILSITRVDDSGDIIGVGGGTMVVLCCVAIVFLTFFMLQIMHGCIAEISGVDLSNGGGVAAARATLGKVTAVTRLAQELYSQENWTNTFRKDRGEDGELTGGTDHFAKEIENGTTRAVRPFEETGKKAEDTINNASDRVSERLFDSKDGHSAAAERLQDTVNETGTRWANGFFESGKQCFSPDALAASYGLSAIPGLLYMAAAVGVYLGTKFVVGCIWAARTAAKYALKFASRITSKTVKTVIRSPAILAKKIAHNKYFKKTGGFAWSVAHDVKTLARRRYRNNRTSS